MLHGAVFTHCVCIPKSPDDGWPGFGLTHHLYSQFLQWHLVCGMAFFSKVLRTLQITALLLSLNHNFRKTLSLLLLMCINGLMISKLKSYNCFMKEAISSDLCNRELDRTSSLKSPVLPTD